MTIQNMAQIVQNYNNEFGDWDTQYEGGCNDLNEMIRYALEVFDNHSTPYRITIVDDKGNIVFHKEKV